MDLELEIVLNGPLNLPELDKTDIEHLLETLSV